MKPSVRIAKRVIDVLGSAVGIVCGAPVMGAIAVVIKVGCGNVVSEVHITRKQYLDGSIPTGFQRTAIVGINGWIPYRGRKIGIQQLALERKA